MKEFEATGYGRTIILELERGEKLIESICSKLEEMNIKNALITSAVGSIQKLVFHRPTDLSAAAVDEIVTLEEPFEIGSLSGTIIDSQAHLHFSAASPSGVYGGHLELGTEVLYLFEVTLTEITGLELERRWTEEKVKKLFYKE